MDNPKFEGYMINIDDQGAAIAELERLKKQGSIVTQALDLFPRGFTLSRGRVVDLACGAGEWALRVARTHPDVEVIGIDISKEAIRYCNDQANSNGIDNVEFRKMDILRPIDFEDESCDLVNMRFVVGALPKEQWQSLLQECYRILKPGGTIHLIEAEASSTEDAPNLHKIKTAIMRALWVVGKTFAEDEMAIGAVINRLLPQIGFVGVARHAYVFDYSAGAALHEPVVEDFVWAVEMMQQGGLLTRFGGMTQDEFEEAFVGMRREMDAPDFAALWYLISFQARKPE